MTASRNLNADLGQAIGEGMSCRWQPGYVPTALYLVMERIAALDVSDALEAVGLDQLAVFEQEPGGTRRRLELLGPDSPGEYVYDYDPVAIEDVAAVQTLMAQIAAWIYERGAAWAAQKGME